MQKIALDEHGVVRFVKNEIVEWLLDLRPMALNEIAIKFAGEEYDDDRMQLAQLIGYSVSGYGDLSYVSKKNLKKADARADKVVGRD